MRHSAGYPGYLHFENRIVIRLERHILRSIIADVDNIADASRDIIETLVWKRRLPGVVIARHFVEIP